MWVRDQYAAKFRRDANTLSWLGRHWKLVVAVLAVLALCVGGVLLVFLIELRVLAD